MKNKTLQAICLAVTVLASNAPMAEIVALPGGGYNVNVSNATPQRGISEVDVLKKFGEPVHRHRAVGTPAISSWEYLQFEVYFENGIVLHTVSKKS